MPSQNKLGGTFNGGDEASMNAVCIEQRELRAAHHRLERISGWGYFVCWPRQHALVPDAALLTVTQSHSPNARRSAVSILSSSAMNLPQSAVYELHKIPVKLPHPIVGPFTLS
jgi:hypothetical protein